MADPDIIKIAGQVAGIGGVAIGTLLIIFKEIIRKNIFPNLTKEHSYRLLKLIVVLVWSVAILGIIAWTYVNKQTGQILPGLNDNAEALSKGCGQEKYSVTLFKYHGSEQGDLSVAFNQFQGILQDKLVALAQEIKASNSNCNYLNKLHLCFINQHPPSGYNSILQYWNKNGKFIIEILTGTIFLKEGEVVVGSRAYFNDAPAHNETLSDLRTVNFDLRVSPDEFGTTRDIHSLITLYALAIDAKRMKLPNNIVAEYLSRAFALSKDLGRNDLRVLIKKELSTLRKDLS